MREYEPEYHHLIEAYNHLIKVEGIDELIKPTLAKVQEVETKYLQGLDPTHELWKPTIKCKDNGQEYYFYCEHCKQEHHHCRENGPRVAHCRDGPYKKNGYILELE